MMEYKILLLFIFSRSINCIIQSEIDEDAYYTAGVVEYIPLIHSTEHYLQDLKTVEDVLFNQATPDIDIIVFPEAVLLFNHLVTYIPEPEENIAPCDNLNYHHYLSELSCYARSLSSYLVFNIVEKIKCQPNETCPYDGYHLFSANVVFDRNGTVVSKYKKSHLYFDEIIDFEVLSPPQQSTFTTDFGVTFGNLISYDLCFYSPAQDMIEQGVTDFVYPTGWFHELPFSSSNQIHQGWAQANDVNLLAASDSYPECQNTGSGIFAGKWGGLDYITVETPTDKLITARVPKKNKKFIPTNKVSKPFNIIEIPPRKMDVVIKKDYNVDLFETKLLLDSQLNLDSEICHNGLCCEFSIKRERRFSSQQYEQYEYRIGAYNGPGTLQRMETTEFGICALFACTTEHLSSCGRIFPSGIVGNELYFKSIDIKASYLKNRRKLVMPSTVNGQLDPLPVDAYRFIRKSKNATYESYELKLLKPQLDILTFGLYGNYFVETSWQHNGRTEIGDKGSWINVY